jgi:hypothetical protein
VWHDREVSTDITAKQAGGTSLRRFFVLSVSILALAGAGFPLALYPVLAVYCLVDILDLFSLWYGVVAAVATVIGNALILLYPVAYAICLAMAARRGWAGKTPIFYALAPLVYLAFAGALVHASLVMRGMPMGG